MYICMHACSKSIQRNACLNSQGKHPYSQTTQQQIIQDSGLNISTIIVPAYDASKHHHLQIEIIKNLI
jgi:hypothetical protein